MRLAVRQRSHRIFIRFMVSYLIVLVMPMMLGIFGFSTAVNIVRKDIEDSNLSMLNQSKDILDEQLSVIHNMSMQIVNEPTVNALAGIKEVDDSFPYYDTKKAINFLLNQRLYLNQDFIYNFYVYFRHTDYIITPDTMYKAPLFYENVLRYKDLDYAKWKEMLFKEFYNGKYFSSMPFESQLNRGNVVTYVQSMPLGFSREMDGALVILVRNSQLEKLFSNIDIAEGGYLYIQNKDGEIVTTFNKATEVVNYSVLEDRNSSEGFTRKKVNGQNMIVIHTTSNNNGWRYVLVLPENVVMHKLIGLKKTIWSIFFISLIIGCLIAYLLAYRNSIPISNMLRQVREFLGEENSKTEVDSFTDLDSTVSKLISSSKSLQEELRIQKPMLEDAFFDKLIKGEIRNNNELEAYSSYTKMDIRKKRYFTLIIRIFGYNDIDNINEEIVQELNMTKVVLRESLHKYIAEKGYLHDVDHQTIAVIFALDKENSSECIEEADAIIKNCNEDIFQAYRIKLFIGGGQTYKNPLEIWRSYEQALAALDYALGSNNNGIAWYKDIPKEKEAYYYPIEVEQRFINHAKLGDISQIEHLIKIVRDENLNKRQLSNEMRRQLIYEMKSTLIKVIPNVNENELLLAEIDKITYSKLIDKNFEDISAMYTNICDFIGKQKSSHNVEMISGIIKYIEEHYMEQELGLYKVSSQFNISEGYLSHFFKEQTEENFTDYVEKIRMAHAVELLKDKNISINDIAERVGYNSVQSFRRAFKRIKGVSPSLMRE
jgi:two-component system, response regulator YesN